MSETVAQRLAALGITLPQPAAPIANYVPFARSGTLLFVSGQLPLIDGSPTLIGKLGDGVTLEQGAAAARQCGINLIAQVSAALEGDLERMRRVVRLGGFVACAPSFASHPKVINGASDLMVEVFGDAGRHARTAVGVPSLPMDAAVEVEGVFELA